MVRDEDGVRAFGGFCGDRRLVGREWIENGFRWLRGTIRAFEGGKFGESIGKKKGIWRG